MNPRHYHMKNTLHDVDRVVVSLKRDVGAVLDDMAVARVEICLAEALTNVIKHAGQTNPDARIDVALHDGTRAVSIDLFDPDGAAPFDLRDHAPDLDAVDPMAESGRGLGLIAQCADDIDYARKGGRFCLTLTFNKTPARCGGDDQ